MARYDVYRTKEGWLALDCQANALDHLNTRLVVPLLSPDEAPLPAARLNPVFSVEDNRMVMVTQFATSLPTSQLAERLTSLSASDYEIGMALDMLITGF